jgi:hypothetical protein
VHHVVPDGGDEVSIARWIEEGKQLFNVWQERVAQVTELQSRLDLLCHRIITCLTEAEALSPQIVNLTDLGPELIAAPSQSKNVSASGSVPVIQFLNCCMEPPHVSRSGDRTHNNQRGSTNEECWSEGRPGEALEGCRNASRYTGG